MKLTISRNNKLYVRHKRYKVRFRASPCFFHNALPKPSKGYAITQENEMPFLKHIGLCGKRKKKIKTLYYKGAYTKTPVECRVVGFSHLEEKRCMLIIEFGEETAKKQVIVFSPYFLDMQNKEFKQNDYKWREVQ